VNVEVAKDAFVLYPSGMLFVRLKSLGGRQRLVTTFSFVKFECVTATTTIYSTLECATVRLSVLSFTSTSGLGELGVRGPSRIATQSQTQEHHGRDTTHRTMLNHIDFDYYHACVAKSQSLGSDAPGSALEALAKTE
jgi:hypothetical protein